MLPKHAAKCYKILSKGDEPGLQTCRLLTLSCDSILSIGDSNLATVFLDQVQPNTTFSKITNFQILEIWADASKLFISLVNRGDHEVPLRTIKKVFAIKNLRGEEFTFPKGFFAPITEMLKILIASNLSFPILAEIVEILPLIADPASVDDMMVIIT